MKMVGRVDFPFYENVNFPFLGTQTWANNMERQVALM